jgi:hypothetical protein
MDSLKKELPQPGDKIRLRFTLRTIPGTVTMESNGKAEKIAGQVQEKVGQVKKVLGS